MRRLIVIAGTLALLGACSSGGCDSSSNKPSGSASEPPSLGGGTSRGGTSETVSFQGLGKSAAPGQTPAVSSAAAALGGSAPLPAQSVICGGFPNLAADCKTDPAFDALKKKCCPTGAIDQCTAIPGGARLLGHGCAAPAAGFTSTPTQAPASTPAVQN
jgi:hypothetical protein